MIDARSCLNHSRLPRHAGRQANVPVILILGYRGIATGLTNFSGIVGASFKEIVFPGNTSVVLHNSERLGFAACWAHARRVVYEVAKDNPYRQRLLDMIQNLYDVNASEAGMDFAARPEHRQQHAFPVLKVIKAYVDSLTESEVLPKSDLGGAMNYLRNHWEALTVYTCHGQVPMDNNRVEQFMRQVVLGRKNWLFVASVESGERVTRLMSVVSSPKRHSLDVWLYLKGVLDQVLAGETNYSKLLLDVWKEAHPEAVRTDR